MEAKERENILEKAKAFFANTTAQSHLKNTQKLIHLSKFNINPFLMVYLAQYLFGKSDPESIARALIYPRILGTSITTTFGTNIQHFCSTVLGVYGSAIAGIDVEFIDQIDNRKKYAQLKAGPKTINKEDIKTIIDHFDEIKKRARVNRLNVLLTDMIVGVFYGTRSELISHYVVIERKHHHPVYVGQEFWYRFTGSEDFYAELIKAIGEAAVDTDAKDLVEDVVHALAKEVKAYLEKQKKV